MPISLPSVERRRFLAGSAALGAAAVLPGSLRACDDSAAAVDPNYVALFADPHIPATLETRANGVNMSTNLRLVLEDLATIKRQPAWSLINGDCAYLTGEPEDYRLLVELLQGSREAGMDFHMTMGNHDRRQTFWKAIPPEAGQADVLNERHITVVEGPMANWFLLDSLVEGTGSGTLGEEQREWLAAELDARPEKPAILALHHNIGLKGKRGFVNDTDELFEVIVPRRQVKAVVFGHSHIWRYFERHGIHMINQPPVSYIFSRGVPKGWLSCRLQENGATITLHAIHGRHPSHGKATEFKWRT